MSASIENRIELTTGRMEDSERKKLVWACGGAPRTPPSARVPGEPNARNSVRPTDCFRCSRRTQQLHQGGKASGHFQALHQSDNPLARRALRRPTARSHDAK